jgi:hypothetical protein
MPQPSPRPAGTGLRRVDEPHPVAAAAQRENTESKQAGKRASQSANSEGRGGEVVTITHRIPGDLRDRLKIAAVRLGRREQDIVAAALAAWLDEHEADSNWRPQ